jgi:hypothetical protein
MDYEWWGIVYVQPRCARVPNDDETPCAAAIRTCSRASCTDRSQSLSAEHDRDRDGVHRTFAMVAMRCEVCMPCDTTQRRNLIAASQPSDDLQGARAILASLQRQAFRVRGRPTNHFRHRPALALGLNRSTHAPHSSACLFPLLSHFETTNIASKCQRR